MSQLREVVYAAYDRILRSPTIQNTMWLGGASALNALLGALTSAVYARLLGVEDFGVLTLLISLTTMLIALTDLGVGGVLIRFLPEKLSQNDTAGVRTVLAYALRGKVAFTAGILLASLLLAAPLVGLVFGHLTERAVDLFLLMLIAVVASSASEFLRYVYYGHRAFRRHSFVAIVPPAVKVALAVGIVLGGGTVTLATVVGIEIASAIAGFLVARVFSPFRSFPWKGEDPLVREGMMRFGSWWALHGVLTIIAARIDVFFLGGLGDARALGLYGAAVKISAILTMMSQSFLTALLPEVSADPGAEAVGRKRTKAWYIVLAFILGLLLVMLISPLLIRLLFGAEFEESAGLLRLMCIGVILLLLSYPLQATMFATNRSAAFSLASGLSVVAMGACSAVLIPRLGPWGAAAAFVASNLATLVAYAVYGAKSRVPRGGPPM